MDIRICGHLQATVLLEDQPRQWDAIVIINNSLKLDGFVSEHAREYLCLCFDDVVVPSPGYVAPDEASIRQALDWARGRTKLIVACHAGIARSSALAYLIASQQWGAKKAIRMLRPTLHAPNALIVSLGARILGQPEIWHEFQAWVGDSSDPLERLDWSEYARGMLEHDVAGRVSRIVACSDPGSLNA